MNIYVVISDDDVEAYTQKGLILYANKKKFSNIDKFECIKTVKGAKEYIESTGASVTHTELIRG